MTLIYNCSISRKITNYSKVLYNTKKSKIDKKKRLPHLQLGNNSIFGPGESEQGSKEIVFPEIGCPAK